MKLFVYPAVLILLQFSSNAIAGIYVGGGIGQTDYSDHGENYNNGTSYEIKGGYLFNNYLAFKIGYINPGKGNGEIVDKSVSGFSFSFFGLASILDNISAYGRLGYFHHQSERESKLAFRFTKLNV